MTANSFVRLALGGPKLTYSVMIGSNREQYLVLYAYYS